MTAHTDSPKLTHEDMRCTPTRGHRRAHQRLLLALRLTVHGQVPPPVVARRLAYCECHHLSRQGILTS